MQLSFRVIPGQSPDRMVLVSRAANFVSLRGLTRESSEVVMYRISLFEKFRDFRSELRVPIQVGRSAGVRASVWSE